MASSVGGLWVLSGPDLDQAHRHCAQPLGGPACPAGWTSPTGSRRSLRFVYFAAAALLPRVPVGRAAVCRAARPPRLRVPAGRRRHLAPVAQGRSARTRRGSIPTPVLAQPDLRLTASIITRRLVRRFPLRQLSSSHFDHKRRRSRFGRTARRGLRLPRVFQRKGPAYLVRQRYEYEWPVALTSHGFAQQ